MQLWDEQETDYDDTYYYYEKGDYFHFYIPFWELKGTEAPNSYI